MNNKNMRGLRSREENPKKKKMKWLSLAIAAIFTVGIIAIVWPHHKEIMRTITPKMKKIDYKKNLTQSWQKSLKGEKVNVDIAVYDQKHKQLITLRDSNQDTFPTASVVKVSVLANLLSQHEAANETLTDDQQALATAMIEDSDNDATTNLLYQMGGYAAPDDLFNALSMNGSKMDVAAWGSSTTTAPDQVILLRNIFYQSNILSSNSQQFAQKLMSQVEPSQRWGITAGVPSDAKMALKNGWLPDDDGWIVNSIGHIKNKQTNYVIAVLTNGSDTEEDGINLIEKLSKQTYRELAK